jgi:hypothetical protein
MAVACARTAIAPSEAAITLQPMRTEAEVDAARVLAALVEMKRRAISTGTEVSEAQNQPWSGPELTSALGLPPERLNAAVPYLERRGGLHVIRTFGSAPYDFNAVFLTAEGRSLHQELQLARADEAANASLRHKARRALNNPWIIGIATGLVVSSISLVLAR